MHSKYHLMEYNKRKRDKNGWVSEKRLMCSSARFTSTSEKNLGFASKHHMLHIDKTKTTIATIESCLLAVIWKEILIFIEQVVSDGKKK